MKDLCHLSTAAIIPIYRDDDNILKVLAKFKEKVVDEAGLCIYNELVYNWESRFRGATIRGAFAS